MTCAIPTAGSKGYFFLTQRANRKQLSPKTQISFYSEEWIGDSPCVKKKKMWRAPTGGAPGGSCVLGSSQFSMSFPRNAFLILTHTFWYTHSHSAEPLPASIFPGYFTNAYPEPPILTLSHGSNCYSIFAPVLKRCERQMSVFQVSERWAPLSVLAAAPLLRERGCSCLCTELLEREWGRM